MQLVGINVVRLGGINNEPGTLAQMLFILVFLHLILSEKLDNLAVYVALSAMLISLSSWGIAAAIITYLALIIKRDISTSGLKLIMGLLVFIGCIAYFLSVGGYDVFVDKMSFESGSGTQKLDIYELLITQWDTFVFMGYGLDTRTCDVCEHLKDSGLLTHFILSFGYLFTLVIFAAISFQTYRKVGIITIPMLFLVALTKFGYDSFVSLFLLGVLLICNNPSVSPAKLS